MSKPTAKVIVKVEKALNFSRRAGWFPPAKPADLEEVVAAGFAWARRCPVKPPREVPTILVGSREEGEKLLKAAERYWKWKYGKKRSETHD